MGENASSSSLKTRVKRKEESVLMRSIISAQNEIKRERARLQKKKKRRRSFDDDDDDSNRNNNERRRRRRRRRKEHEG